MLVTLERTPAADRYVNELIARTPAFDGQQSTCVVTAEHIPGLPAPGLLVADRWGEIVHVVTPNAVTELPSAARLLHWLEAIEYRCPECEGEAR